MDHSAGLASDISEQDSQVPVGFGESGAPPIADQEALKAIVGRIDPGELAARMVSAFRGVIDGYRRLPEPVIEGQIFEISRRNVELFLRSLLESRGLTAEDLAPVRESAKDRATEGMPLEDLLHAYRMGARIGWQAFTEAARPAERQVLVRVAEVLMDFVDSISSAVSQAYLEESQHLVSERERQQRGLLDALLAGRELSAELRILAEGMGIPVADRYRPFAAAIPGGLARRHSELAAVLRSQGVLALTEGVRVSGLAPDTQVPIRVPADGAVIAVGPAADRSELAAALEDMRRLADLGGRLGLSGTLDDHELLPELLLANAPRAAAGLERRVLTPLETHRSRRGVDLVETLRQYVESNLDRRLAAERLHVHPNTLDYRLRQIRELSGIDVHRLDDLVLVVLALRRRQLVG
jgi:PucR C-terminal helix-turn-helix domain